MRTQQFESTYNGKRLWSIVFLVLAPILSAIAVLFFLTVRLAKQEGVESVSFKGGKYLLQPGDRLLSFVDAISLNELLYQFVIPFALLCIMGLLLKWDWKSFIGLDHNLTRGHWLYLLGSIAVLFLAGFLMHTEAATDNGIMMRLIQDNSLISLILIPGLLLPIIEEVVFRRFIYDLFAYKRFYPYIPIAITTILFTLLHSQYSGIAVAYILLLGVILGYARYFSKGILLPIIIHSVNNILPILLLQ